MEEPCPSRCVSEFFRFTPDGRQAALRLHRATRRAVVPWQASATVSIADSSEYTFPAMDALQPAGASPAARLFREPDAAVRPREARRCVRRTGTSPPPVCNPGVHEIARRISVTAGSWALPRALTPSAKNADGPPPHPHPSADPPLHLRRAPPGVKDRMLTPADTRSAVPTDGIDKERFCRRDALRPGARNGEDAPSAARPLRRLPAPAGPAVGEREGGALPDWTVLPDPAELRAGAPSARSGSHLPRKNPGGG
jgi:hypothetical protein